MSSRILVSLSLVLLSPLAMAGIDLHSWKLQIPGPREIKDLDGYRSNYFERSDDDITFRVDAAEKGSTEHSHYVRSELRHLTEWTVDGSHTLEAELKADSRLSPDKLTVIQIHGIEADGDNAPPLLRVALNGGDLVAFVKSSPSGEGTEKIPLVKKLGSAWVKVRVSVSASRLRIAVNGSEKSDHGVGYWKFKNYFKAGAYPQAHAGSVAVQFRRLHVE